MKHLCGQLASKTKKKTTALVLLYLQKGRSIPVSLECMSSGLVCQLPQHGTIRYTYHLLSSATVERVFRVFSFHFLSPLSSLPSSSLPPPLLSVHALHKFATIANAQAVPDRYTALSISTHA